MKLVRDVGFASCYSFTYSARPGTPAANMLKNLVHDSKIANERLQRLQALILEQQVAFNKNSVGLTLPVLLDRKGKRAGQLQGRSPYNQSVYVTANERLMGEIVEVHIQEGFDQSLTAQ
jgi:tRNA-2-methylthio-N6-dimethylallyladenosine synthase